MRAIALFPREGQLRLVDVPTPALTRPTQVRFRVLEVGICGTDRELTHLTYGRPPAHSDHLILGHECLGEVVEVGPAVQGLRPGTLVVPRVRRPCPVPTCGACRAGRPDFCETGEYVERGIVGAHGFMADQVVEDAAYLHPVPRSLHGVGVLTEPLTIAEKALVQAQWIRQRIPDARLLRRPQRALVFGAGPVGLLGALALRRAGYDVTVYSRGPASSAPAKVAQDVGARYVSGKDCAPDKLHGEAGPFDLIYEAAGASEPAFKLLQAQGANGTFIFTGVPGRKHPMTIDGAGLMRQLVLQNQVVMGTVNAGPEAYTRAIADLAAFEERWPGCARGMLTSSLRPAEAPEALRASERSGIKTVVRFSELAAG